MSPGSDPTLPQDVGFAEVPDASTKVMSGAEVEVERRQDHLDARPAQAEGGMPAFSATQVPESESSGTGPDLLLTLTPSS